MTMDIHIFQTVHLWVHKMYPVSCTSGLWDHQRPCITDNFNPLSTVPDTLMADREWMACYRVESREEDASSRQPWHRPEVQIRQRVRTAHETTCARSA